MPAKGDVVAGGLASIERRLARIERALEILAADSAAGKENGGQRDDAPLLNLPKGTRMTIEVSDPDRGTA